MFTPGQLRAARALLGISQKDLADRSGVHINSINSLENGVSDPKQSTLIKLRIALSSLGVEFTDATRDHGAGVRFKNPS